MEIAMASKFGDCCKFCWETCLKHKVICYIAIIVTLSLLVQILSLSVSIKWR